MLALLDAPGFGEPVVYASNAAPVKGTFGGLTSASCYVREAAGRAFFERHERSAVVEEPKATAGKKSKKADVESDGEDDMDMKNKGLKGATLKLSDLLKDENLYALLNVTEGASDADLKKAYRALCLSSHPDKLAHLPEDEQKQVQENFVKIQEANEVLSDPVKRQLYDSSLPFDDEIPKFKQGGNKDFYEVFDEVFKRNARFSTKRPVPEIGGEETPLAEVRKFYDFWFAFSSWRDPITMAQAAGEDLEDMEQCEDRYERRWVMRENMRIGKKYAKEEKERVSLLAATAEKNDPRLLAEKNAKKDARAAELLAKEEERMIAQRAKEEEERKKQEAEEAERATEAARRQAEKQNKEAAKNEVKKCRQRLRAFYPRVETLVMRDQLDEVCTQLPREALETLGDQVEAELAKGDSIAGAVELFYAAITSLGLKPMQPEPVQEDDEDNQSTASGSLSAEHGEPAVEEIEEDPAERAERLALEAKREEQRKKQEQLEAAKRKQREKKEKEKAKKDEEKAQKAAELEEQKKAQQRDEATRKEEEKAAKAAEAAATSATSEAVAPAPTAAAGKKGKKAAAKPEEEDLDALFAEFGVTVTSKKNKKKKASD